MSGGNMSEGLRDINEKLGDIERRKLSHEWRKLMS
jgi:hypothetical protein